MRLEVIDHTEPHWYEIYKKLKRENGAKTYSEEICEYQVPVWKQELESAGIKSAVIGTCRLLRSSVKMPKDVDVVVQYLHTFIRANPLKEVQSVLQDIPANYKKIIFVTAYKELAEIIEKYGQKAIWVPMAVDVEEIKGFKVDESDRYPEVKQRIIYFGNMTSKKNRTFSLVKIFLRMFGWQVDILTNSRLNYGDKVLSQQECWETISRYRYGIGVGRAALEMMALGLKVMLCGYHQIEIIENRSDFLQQRKVNFTGFGSKKQFLYVVRNIKNAAIMNSDIKKELGSIRKTIRKCLTS